MTLNRPFSCLLLCLAIAAGSWCESTHAQERERLISPIRSGVQPTMIFPGGAYAPTNLVLVEVIEFKHAGVSVTPGKPFRADEDWLTNLTVRVKNISDRPLPHISMSFGLPEAKFVKDGRQYSMGLTLAHKVGARMKENDREMKAVMPGEEVELFCLNCSLEFREIANRTGVTSITLVNSGGDVSVFFEDGGRWMGSNLQIRAAAKPNP